MANKPHKPPDKLQGHRQKGKHLRVLVGDPNAPVPDLPEELQGGPAKCLPSTLAAWEGFWRSAVGGGADRSSDMPRLYRWIIDVDELTRVTRSLRRKRLVAGSMGQPVLNPLASYKAQLERSIAATEEHFGMTHLARMRLGIAAGQAQKTLDDLNADLDDGGEEYEEPEGLEIIEGELA